MITGLLVVSLAAAVWYLTGFGLPEHSWRRSAVKTVVVAGLAVACWRVGGPLWLTLGLALGALGDLLLSRPGKPAFLAGVASFAVAHLAYVALFAAFGVSDPTRLLSGWRAIATLGLLIFAGSYARLLWRRAGALRGPVTGYVCVIVLLGLAAIALPGYRELAIAAAGLFILSDAVLAAELFVMPAELRWRRVSASVVWATYWSAQMLFFAAFGDLGLA